jgi:hypothetical protein
MGVLFGLGRATPLLSPVSAVEWSSGPMGLTFREMTTLVIATAIVAACATAPPRTAAERQAACPLTQADSAFLSRGPVYRDCAVDTKAKLIVSSSRVNFTPPRPALNCYAVDLEVVVDTLGRPEVQTAHVLRSNDAAYADAVLSEIANWRFEVAMLNHRPVRQIATLGQRAGSVVVPAGSPPPSRPPVATC